MTSIVAIIIGMALLAVALVARHDDNAIVTILTGWTGCILVVVGMGKLIFLD